MFARGGTTRARQRRQRPAVRAACAIPVFWRILT